jgi:hypothetical protein
MQSCFDLQKLGVGIFSSDSSHGIWFTVILSFNFTWWNQHLTANFWFFFWCFTLWNIHIFLRSLRDSWHSQKDSPFLFGLVCDPLNSFALYYFMLSFHIFSFKGFWLFLATLWFTTVKLNGKAVGKILFVFNFVCTLVFASEQSLSSQKKFFYFFLLFFGDFWIFLDGRRVFTQRSGGISWRVFEVI